MTKRIAFISDHASPVGILGGVDSGGQNVYVGQLAKNLAALGYEVDIFTRRDSKRLPEIAEWVNGIRIIHVPAGPPDYVPKEQLLPFMGDFADYVLQFFKCQRKGYDLVHPNFWMSGLVACEIKRQLGIPFVVTFHALGRVRRLHQKDADKFPNERFDIEDRIVTAADRIIAECPQDEEDLIRLYNADPAKVTIVPCGFDPTEIWPISKPLARFALGLPPEERVILQLGRLVPRKGIDTAIRGFARLVKNHGIEACMHIVGGESEEPDPAVTPEIGRLREIAKEEGVAERVTFVGRRGRESLKYYYSAADIFVTTPWYEPFGITPVESMACGTPVVGSNVGGIKFTVRDGETGYLVRPKDADALAERLAHLYEHPKLMSVLSRQAIRRANDLFTWHQVASSMAAVYEEVLAPTRSRRQEQTQLVTVLNRSFDQLVEVLQESRRRVTPALLDAADLVSNCIARGGRILISGSGPSGMEALRLTSKFVDRFKNEERVGLPAVMVSETFADPFAAVDREHESLLLRHIETVGKAGDVFIGITATKRSRSVLAAFRSARNQGLHSIALTGQNSGDLPQAADIAIIVPSGEREHILQSQLVIIHLLCELVEERLASETHFTNVAQFPAAKIGRSKVKSSGRRGNLDGANAGRESASNGGNKTYARPSGKSGNRNRERAGTR
ncbi:MAG: glycosyltransferase [Acidobacteria bacterium]|nr:MAG: glycosyltransferase [Acidobacteriota bacterium]